MPKNRYALFTAAALTLSLTACGGSDKAASTGDAKGAGAAELAAALDKPTELDFWTWVPNVQKTVDLFEKKYPKIKVNIVNTGKSEQHYPKLQNALKAGTGAPDVTQVEYFALPQFAITKGLVDLTPYAATDLEGRFTPSAWSQVKVNGGIYGVPQDTGPMAMFYRKDILEKFGVTPPKTWEEFRAAAKKVHDADPGTSLTYVDQGDSGIADSLMWQMGAKNFDFDSGSGYGVNLKTDPGVKTYADTIGGMVKDKLIEPTPSWNDDWWRSMNAGKYPVWMAGAWAPAVMEKNMPETKGKWGVAPMPTGADGKAASSENGGSSVAVTTQSKNKVAAAAFAQWLNSDPEAVRSLNTDVGLFPATKVLLDDPAFRNAPVPMFGDQKANAVFAESSYAVRPGWRYLPFQVYANSVFKDTVGQQYTASGDLLKGLSDWQDRITAYGKEQGFTVK